MQRRLSPPVLVVGIGALLFAIHVAFLIAQTNHAVKLFAGFAFDGALQHLNPLYRLADGQRPGADFPVFHGAALPVLHYPLFSLLGGDFFGAELSRRITAGLAGTLVPLAFVCAVARRPRTIAVAFLALTPMLFWPWLREHSVPGTSLIGVRAAMPVLAVALLYWLSTSERPRVARLRRGLWLEAIAGVLAALAFLLGTEQGLGLLVGLLVAVLVTPARGERLRARARSAAVLGGAFAAGLVVVGGAIMGGGLLDGIRYALSDVPVDQGWYFGAPPNTSLTEIGELTGTNLWFILTLAALAPAVVWRLRGADAGAWAVLALAIYGLLSTVSLFGYVSMVNLIVASRVLVLILVWLLVVVAPGRLPARLGGLRTPALLAGLWIAFAAIPVLGEVKREAGYVRAELANPPEPQGRYAGIGLNRDWTDHVTTLDRLERTDCSTMWSTYGGVVEAELGLQNPTGFDYLIHTVGSRRAPYLAAFDRERPECFSTGRRSTLLGYEEWLWNANWDLYRRLLNRYEPKTTTPFSLVWERADEPQITPGARTQLSPAATDQDIALPAADPTRPVTLYEITVRYRARNLLGKVPLVGTLPRSVVIKEDTLSPLDVYLPPDRTTWSFPVLVAPGAQPTLRLESQSALPGARLEVKEVVATALDLPDRNLAFWTEATGGPSSPDPAPRTQGF